MGSDVKRYDSDKKPRSSRELILKIDEEDRPRKRSAASKILLYLGVFAVLFVLIAFSAVNFLRRPANANGEFKYFEIEQGCSLTFVASELKNEGLIRSRFAFIFLSKVDGSSIKAGYYKLSSSMGLDEIIDKLEKGEVDAFSVTIPEGYRVLQIAKTLSEKGEISSGKFIEAAIGTEGTLFPDTYVFPTNSEPAKIVRTMKENYDKKIAGKIISTDQLILASIVEREAKNDDERAKIAAVYEKRAKNNMLLQADPTIRYALDTQTYLKDHSVNFDFWKGITKSDYQSLNSPFNTYKQKGYPPAPICNPGIKSIEAALNPAKDFGDYLYFFHDKDGTIHFSKTFEEHTSQIQQYGVSG